MADDSIVEVPKRIFTDGEDILIKAHVVSTRDIGNIVIDCAGKMFPVSADGLVMAEPGLDDVIALETRLRGLYQQRKDLAAAAKKAAEAKPANA